MKSAHKTPKAVADRVRLAALLVLAAAAVGGVPRLFAAGTGTTALHTPQGNGAGTANGDYVSSGIDTTYRYFVEVPSGLSRLQIQLFDADFGLGGAGEAAAGRDRARGGFNSSVTYSLVDPSGAARTTRFTTGDTTQPVGSDNAWLDLYNGTGNNVLDQFGAAAYNNNNGNNNWSTNWIETGDDGAAGTGLIQITGGQLRISDNAAGAASSIEREADAQGTPGMNLVQAYWTFDFNTSGNLEAGDTIVAEISSNGAAGPFTVLETFSGNVTGSRQYDVTSFISNNTRVRFRVTGGYNGNGGTEFFFVDNAQIFDGGALTAGHWEIRVDESSTVTAGDDINALGIRAHDGDATSGGTELPVYYDSHVQIGVNPPGSGSATRSYTLYPWITSGCSCSSNDHDYDTDSGTTGSLAYSSRTGAFNQSLAAATLSVDNAWNRDTMTGWTSDSDSVDYGIWSLAASITSYNGGASGNYANVYLGNFNAAVNPPGANPTANTFRVYLPTDAGAAPVKPYVEQFLRLTGAPNTNPPAVGQTTRFVVTVRVVNPTARAITFSATNLVTVNVPGPATAVTYQGSGTVSQGAIVTQPAVGGTGNITWNPGTLAAGTTAILYFRANITPTVAGQRITVTATPASGNGTRATYVDETGNSTQARATYTAGPVCEVAATVGINTAALVTDLRVAATREGNLVSWKTASEAGTAGFEVERVTKQIGAEGELVRRLVPALLKPEGGSYRVLDARSGPDVVGYRVFEVEARGARRLAGVASVGGASAADVAEGAELAKGSGFASEARAAKLPKGAPTAPRATPSGAPAVDDAVKIEVSGAGVYYLSAADIAATLGAATGEIQSRIARGSLALTNRGRSVSYRAASRGAGLTFYAEAIDSPYTDTNVYWLRRATGALMGSEDASAPPPAPGGTFPESRHFESDRIGVTVLPLDAEGDYWFWDYLTAGSPTDAVRAFTIDAPGLPLSKAGGGGTLAVRLQGATATGVSGEHRVRVSVNGVPLADESWEGLARHDASVTIPPGVLVAGANTVEVSAVLDPGVPYSTFFVDALDLAYERALSAQGPELAFTPAANRVVTVDGFAEAAIEVLAITSPTQPAVVSKTTLDASGGAYRVSFISARTGGRYLAYTPSALRTPSRLSRVPAASLARPIPGAAYVVVTSSALAPAAQRLAGRRQAQGLDAMVVDFEQIVDEFADGIRTPHAIRALLLYARKNWKVSPRYLLLAGAGHFDYKDHYGFGGNLVPPLMASTPTGLFPSDNRLVDFDGDSVPDVAVGRVTARSAAELDAYVDKVIAYENGAPSGRALFLADDAPDGGGFDETSDELAAVLPPPYAKTKASLAQMSLAAARAQLSSEWAFSPGVVSFVGHGGLDRMAAEGLLVSADVPGLPATASPIVSAFTCTINRYGIPGFTALGEELVNRAGGGAIASWAPSGLSDAALAKVLAGQFFRDAFANRAPRLGDAVRGALGGFLGLGGSAEMSALYTLLGDPALRLAHPAPPSSPGGGSGE